MGCLVCQTYFAIGYQVLGAEQARAARAILRWKVAEAAVKAGVSPNTIVRMESGAGMNSATVKAIQAAYEVAGIEFIPENGGGAGARLKERSK
jgi:transcriptional regulator with XRE-family HTH domain